MKRIKKSDLMLKKEVISFLSNSEMALSKGGENKSVDPCNTISCNQTLCAGCSLGTQNTECGTGETRNCGFGSTDAMICCDTPTDTFIPLSQGCGNTGFCGETEAPAGHVCMITNMNGCSDGCVISFG